mmetsp:Transcript_935/g.1641  ORF Transcript_935/g.1641 Transcript_935/m.1641 type:complete len:546 (+) Transcript_935:43-1680(+)
MALQELAPSTPRRRVTTQEERCGPSPASNTRSPSVPISIWSRTVSPKTATNGAFNSTSSSPVAPFLSSTPVQNALYHSPITSPLNISSSLQAGEEAIISTITAILGTRINTLATYIARLEDRVTQLQNATPNPANQSISEDGGGHERAGEGQRECRDAEMDERLRGIEEKAWYMQQIVVETSGPNGLSQSIAALRDIIDTIYCDSVKGREIIIQTLDNLRTHVAEMDRTTASLHNALRDQGESCEGRTDELREEVAEEIGKMDVAHKQLMSDVRHVASEMEDRTPRSLAEWAQFLEAMRSSMQTDVRDLQQNLERLRTRSDDMERKQDQSLMRLENEVQSLRSQKQKHTGEVEELRQMMERMQVQYEENQSEMFRLQAKSLDLQVQNAALRRQICSAQCTTMVSGPQRQSTALGVVSRLLDGVWALLGLGYHPVQGTVSTPSPPPSLSHSMPVHSSSPQHDNDQACNVLPLHDPFRLEPYVSRRLTPHIATPSPSKVIAVSPSLSTTSPLLTTYRQRMACTNTPSSTRSSYNHGGRMQYTFRLPS